MKITVPAAACIGAACVLLSAGARATTIDFDDVVGAGSLGSPTNVDTRYASLGVTFADPAGPDGAVLASVVSVPTTTPPNIFFANQHQASDAGDLQINFASGVSSVSLDDFLSYDYDLSYFVYGHGGALLTSGSGPPEPSYGGLQVWSASGVGEIYQVVLTSHPVSSPGYFGNFSIDNLTFPGVPEPSTWALFIFGGGLTGASLRTRWARREFCRRG